MNLFLIHKDVAVSCHSFAAIDPLRARKQLLESCQLIASVDHLLWKQTAMLKQDGTPYKEGYVNHPITRHLLVSKQNYTLAVQLAVALAHEFPTHACAKSIDAWRSVNLRKTMKALDSAPHNTFCVCRRGVEVKYVVSLTEYSKLILQYLRKHKWDK